MADDEQQPAGEAPGTALAERRPTDVAMTARAITGWTPQEVIGNATAIADQLKAVVEKNGMSVSLDRRNPDRKHLEIGAWQTAGTLLGALGGQALHAETVWSRPITDSMGEPEITEYTQHIKRYHKGGGIREEITSLIKGKSYEARVEVRTADGTVLGTAEGQCDRTENTWATRDDYALRSMAETRAESRAYRRAIGWIFQLAGYTTTPAEEMGHDETRGAPQPMFGPALAKARRAEAFEALQQILERAGGGAVDTKQLAGDVMGNVKRIVAQAMGDDGYLPSIAVDLLVELAKAHAYAVAKLEALEETGAPGGGDTPEPHPVPVQPTALEVAQADMRAAMAAQDPQALEAAQARARAAMPPPERETEVMIDATVVPPPYDGGPSGVSPTGERLPNTVPAPLKQQDDTPERWLNRLRSSGCICPQPLGDPPKRTDRCPIIGHSDPLAHTP